MTVVQLYKQGRPSRSAYFKGVLIATGVLFMYIVLILKQHCFSVMYVTRMPDALCAKWGGRLYFLQIPQHSNTWPFDLVTPLERNLIRLAHNLARQSQAAPHVVVPPLPVEISPPVAPAWWPETYTAPQNLKRGYHTTSRFRSGIRPNVTQKCPGE